MIETADITSHAPSLRCSSVTPRTRSHHKYLKTEPIVLLPIGALLLATIVVICGVGLTLTALVLIAIAAALFIPLIGKATQGRLDIFEPLVLADIALMTMFLARPLVDIIGNSFIHDGYSVLPTFDATLIIALLGICSFQVGYNTRLAQRLARSSFRTCSDFTVRRGIQFAGILMFLATVLTVVFFASSGGVGTMLGLLKGRSSGDDLLFRSSTGYLYLGPNLFIPASLLFFICALKSKRSIYYLSSAIAATPLVGLGLARGDRSVLLPLLVGLIIIFYGWKRRRPNVITLLACAVAFIVTSSAIRERRDVDVQSHQIGQAALFDLPKATMSMISESDNEMFDTMANELLVVPARVPFRPFCTVTDLLVRAVPRPLYSDKPLECPDAIINTLWPEHYQTTRAVQATSIMGSLYADSGIIGVCIGMFGIGFALRFCWSWFQRDPKSPGRLIAYSTMPALAVVLLRGTFPDTAGRSLYTLVPLIAFALAARTNLKRFGLMTSGGLK